MQNQTNLFYHFIGMVWYQQEAKDITGQDKRKYNYVSTRISVETFLLKCCYTV
jgi:hypothetical protein